MTIAESARNFDVDPEILRRKVNQKGFETSLGSKYSIKQYVSIIYGDKEFEQTRKLSAEADLAEMEREEKCGRMINADVLKEVTALAILPLKGLLDGMPKTVASRANPSDPQTAELAIKESVDNICKQMQKTIERGFKNLKKSASDEPDIE